MVSKDVSENGYAGFDGREAWVEAIYWAKAKPEFLNPPSWTERVVHVGKASSRLIQRYKIQLSAFGAYVSTVNVTQICNQTISLVRFVGGACAPDISVIVVGSKAVHNGFFIFGTKFHQRRGNMSRPTASQPINAIVVSRIQSAAPPDMALAHLGSVDR